MNEYLVEGTLPTMMIQDLVQNPQKADEGATLACPRVATKTNGTPDP